MKSLLFHGAIVVLFGLISGFFYWVAILRDDEDGSARWRVAHAFLVIEGMFMLLVGLLVPHVVLHDQALSLLVWTTIVSGYAFVFAFVVGSFGRLRGLTVTPLGLNTLLFVGHCVGATGSLVTTTLLAIGLLAAL